MKNLSILLLSLFFIACQQKEIKKDTVNASDTIPSKQQQADHKLKNKEKIQEVNTQEGDTIFMNYKDENGLYTAEGTVSSLASKVYIKFKNENAGELIASIIPSSGKGNIRFNQIIFPDNTSDGPFSMDLKTSVEQNGNYILVVGHSQMADNPYLGKFIVHLEIKKN